MPRSPRPARRPASGSSPRPRPGARRSEGVRAGLDVLAARRFGPLRRRTVGLVCNPTAVTRDLATPPTCCTRRRASGSPRSSARSTASAATRSTWRRSAARAIRRTGLPVHSLYGETRRVADAAARRRSRARRAGLRHPGRRPPLLHLPVTMTLCMEARGRGGHRRRRARPAEPDRRRRWSRGTWLRARLRELRAACTTLAERHGMTVGELARLFRAERRHRRSTSRSCPARAGGGACASTRHRPALGAARRPNMPTPDTALVYPGMCLLEGTNLSEGRGTTRPFELFGAPWLDAPPRSPSALAARAAARRRVPPGQLRADLGQARRRALPRGRAVT